MKYSHKIILGVAIAIFSSIPVFSSEGVKDLTQKDIFLYFSNYYSKSIPESYQYINLNFRGEYDTELTGALQKLVYLDKIKNSQSKIYSNRSLSAYSFYTLTEHIFEIQLDSKESKEELKQRNTNINDLKLVQKYIKDSNKSIITDSKGSKEIKVQKAIFNDVYNTIKTGHYNKNNISESNLINSAIQGIAEGADDRHTVYFPAIESKNFFENLNGEYEGIGAYVDMETPGVLKILSPISDSPAQKAGLLADDIVSHVDGKEVTEENSLQEVVTWIKGPAGTTVVLTIIRDSKTFEIEVTREAIIIKDVEYEKINSKTFYININSFGENVSEHFKEALVELNQNSRVSKVIIDVRNNGGGFLDQVSDILGYFVPKGEPTAVVKYLNRDLEYKSKGYELVDFSKYQIVLIQNGGSASASEILVGTIKDYYPDAKIVGEQSYGKGSVQTIRSYTDNSFLKYTIAGWYTGKTQTGIDGVGITPDYEVEFDLEAYQKNESDNQLNKAIQLR